MTLAQGSILVAAWLAYFAAHSALASLRAKRWVSRRWPGLLPAYRLVFNGLALLLLSAPLSLLVQFRGELLWHWTGTAQWIVDGASVLALCGFVWSLRYYDGLEFLGLRQWRARMAAVEDQEVLRISPLHRFVRHPWYSLGLILVWTRSMDAALLLSALMITGYFAVGSRLEERKLLIYHGQPYANYRRQVPRLIPVPWRFLSREAAAALVPQARAAVGNPRLTDPGEAGSGRGGDTP